MLNSGALLDPLNAAAVGVAYLLGSIPFGVIAGRACGIDVTREGSGNIGATNVARTVGPRLALLVLLLDAAKGAAPLALERWVGWPPAADSAVLLALGLAPVLGHCFCVWLRFRGGKGVATSLGVLLVLSPAVAGLSVVIFATVYALSRAASLGSLAATLAMPGLLWVFHYPHWVLALAAALAVVVVVQHRANIRRLLSKSELKV